MMTFVQVVPGPMTSSLGTSLDWYTSTDAVSLDTPASP